MMDNAIGSTVKISEKHLAWACRSDPAPRRSRESGDRWRFAQIVSAVYKNAGRDVDSYVMLLAPESTVLDAHGRVVPSIADSKEAEVITMKANEFHEYVCESHAEVPALCARAQRDAEAVGKLRQLADEDIFARCETRPLRLLADALTMVAVALRAWAAVAAVLGGGPPHRVVAAVLELTAWAAALLLTRTETAARRPRSTGVMVFWAFATVRHNCTGRTDARGGAEIRSRG